MTGGMYRTIHQSKWRSIQPLIKSKNGSQNQSQNEPLLSTKERSSGDKIKFLKDFEEARARYIETRRKLEGPYVPLRTDQSHHTSDHYNNESNGFNTHGLFYSVSDETRDCLFFSVQLNSGQFIMRTPYMVY